MTHKRWDHGAMANYTFIVLAAGQFLDLFIPKEFIKYSSQSQEHKLHIHDFNQ
jgi:hypothetical protein